MNIHPSHIDNINELLHKFHAGTITPEEYAQLTSEIKETSDFELREMLHVHWESFDGYEELPEEKIACLYDKDIRPQIEVPANLSMFTYLKRYWLQIAVSLLILIMGGLTVKFYTESRVIHQLAERPITIYAGESGSSAVMLPDGTKVRLNAKSSLSYRQDFGQKDRQVSLQGEGYFEVKHDEKKRFVVNTEVMDIAVLGTTFNVYAYKEKDFVEMALVEGHVQVTPLNHPDQIIDVHPNEKVTYDKTTGKLNLERTSNRMETSWLNNELVFRHDKLQDVFSSLERKFGVVFRVDNPELLQDVYTGTFEKEKLETILQILQIHYGFEYRLEDGTVYIKY